MVRGKVISVQNPVFSGDAQRREIRLEFRLLSAAFLLKGEILSVPTEY